MQKSVYEALLTASLCLLFYYPSRGDGILLYVAVLNGVGLDSDADMSLIKYICMEIIWAPRHRLRSSGRGIK